MLKKDSCQINAVLLNIFSSNNPGGIYHRFHKNIKQTVFNIDNNKNVTLNTIHLKNSI